MTCAECGDVAVARGLCDTCYGRARREGRLEVVRPRRTVPPDERAAMREAHRAGESINGIARRLGRGPATVFRYVAGRLVPWEPEV